MGTMRSIPHGFRFPGRAPAERDAASVVGQVADHAGKLGIDLVDVAANIDVLSETAAGQAETFGHLHVAAKDMQAGNSQASVAADAVLDYARQAASDVEASRGAVQDSLTSIETLITWVGSIGGQLESTRGALAGIGAIAKGINAIAERTHILALNARIEAARSGEGGKGFTVIADNVRQLADQAMAAAGDIDTTLGSLGDQLRVLTDQGSQAREHAKGAQEATRSIGSVLDTFGAAMTGVDQQVSAIADVTLSSGQQIEEFITGLTGLVESVESSSRELHTARSRVYSLLDVSEALIGDIASMGIPTPDTPFIAAAQEAAARISALFEQAVAAGAVTLDDLFDEDYRPIPGSDPAQHMARCTPFTDRALPDIQEPLLALDDRVAFAAAVDRNGYLPTHNRAFSQPPSTDPVWNAAHCRNRRIFADRTGLAAARNVRPFLLQTYRRDMGGGTFVLMKDASAPIMVGGRHWGGLRLAYRVQ